MSALGPEQAGRPIAEQTAGFAHPQSALPRRLVVVAAGLRSPSTTRMLADRLADASRRAMVGRGLAVEVAVVELRDHARDLTTMLLTGVAGPGLRDLLGTLARADAVVLATPIYSGAYTGMVKDLVDLLPDGALAGVPVLMAATAGTARHTLALEHTVRPLLSYLGAVVVPTGVFAATEDFGQVGDGPDAAPLAGRVALAAEQLAALVAQQAPRPAPADPFGQVVEFTELLGGQ